MTLSGSGWSGLPKDILDSILDCIIHFSDYIRFCSVCKPWYLVALGENNYHPLQKQRLSILKACRGRLPMLMVPPTNNTKEKQSFYSVTDGVVHDLQLPMHYKRRCFGSSLGWLFFMEKPMITTLLNPLNGKTIHLPDSLGDQALFLGDNDSVVVLASNSSGWFSNCIYYIDHYFEISNYVSHGSDDDTSVFNLTAGSFRSHCRPNPEHLVLPIWIVPNLREDVIQPIYPNQATPLTFL